MMVLSMKRNAFFFALAAAFQTSLAMAGGEDAEAHYIYDLAVDAYNTGKYVVAVDGGPSGELEGKLGRQLALAAEAAAAGSKDWAELANISPEQQDFYNLFYSVSLS